LLVASGHSQNDGPEILTPAQAAAWTLHDPLPESYAEGSESPFLALHGFCFFCEGCLVVKIDHLQMGRPWHSNQYFYREGRFCMFGASRDFSGLTTQPLPQRKQFDSSPNCCYCRPGLRKRSRPTRILRCTAAKARVGCLRRHTASTAGTSPRSSGAFPVKALKNWHGVLLYMVHLTFKYQFGC
jgi:hypothetical protein